MIIDIDKNVLSYLYEKTTQLEALEESGFNNYKSYKTGIERYKKNLLKQMNKYNAKKELPSFKELGEMEVEFLYGRTHH